MRAPVGRCNRVVVGECPCPVLLAWIWARNPARARALESAATFDFEALLAARHGDDEWAAFRVACAAAALRRAGVQLVGAPIRQDAAVDPFVHVRFSRMSL